MAEERFNVVVFDGKGYWHYEARDLPAKEAVEMAKRLTVLSIDLTSHISKVMITDADDMTNFLWERGKGIIFPTREEAEQ